MAKVGKDIKRQPLHKIKPDAFLLVSLVHASTLNKTNARVSPIKWILPILNLNKCAKEGAHEHSVTCRYCTCEPWLLDTLGEII